MGLGGSVDSWTFQSPPDAFGVSECGFVLELLMEHEDGSERVETVLTLYKFPLLPTTPGSRASGKHLVGLWRACLPFFFFFFCLLKEREIQNRCSPSCS